MLPSFIRNYLLSGIAGMPGLLELLLNGVEDASPRWDVRPDPERFTLREILAHLADFDEIWMERFERMLSEEHPELPNWDEAAAATENSYALQAPRANLARLHSGRARLSTFLQELTDEGWRRTASRPPLFGDFNLEQAVVLVQAHDVYHLDQITRWLHATR